MVHILIFILKILGIILLVLLGLILLVLLLVLFVPLRYQALGQWPGEKEGEAGGEAGVFWLFHFLSFRGVWKKAEARLKLRLKVLGVTVWKMEKSLPEKEESEKEETEETEKDELEKNELEKNGSADLTDLEKELSRELEEDEARYRKQAQERRERLEEENASCGSAGKSTGKRREKTPQESEPFSERPGFCERIRIKIKSIIEKLTFSFRAICDKLKGIRDFTEEKKAWITDTNNQASVRLILRQAKKLIIHIWPRKGKGSIVFGFEDPSTTGQVLAAASLIYPFCHRQLTLEPVFDEQIFKFQGSFKGRIRVWNLLWILLMLIRDRYTRKLLRGLISK